MASAFVSPVTFVHPTRRVELFGNILYRQVVKNIVDVMMERLKMQDWEMTDQIARVINAGLETDGPIRDF